MEYSIRVIEDACKPFSNMHSVLHAIKSRFGHSSLSATVQRRKSPCMYSLNALSYWMGSSTTHIANAQGFQYGCYALLDSGAKKSSEWVLHPGTPCNIALSLHVTEPTEHFAFWLFKQQSEPWFNLIYAAMPGDVPFHDGFESG